MTGDPSPATIARGGAVGAQEATCARLWAELIDAAQQHAAVLDSTRARDAHERALRCCDALESFDDPATPGSASANVLIVDDEAGNLTALEAVLDGPGYRIVRAASGEEALHALMTHEFACILLDVRMEGMSGFELARMIKQRRMTARVPIIFLTASVNGDQQVLEGYEIGAVDFVHKPFNPVVLRRKVEVFVDLHHMHRQLRLLAVEREKLAHAESAHVAAVEAGRRAGFLAEASRLLSLSLDFDDMMATALELCVPMLGVEAVIIASDKSERVRWLQMRPIAAAEGSLPLVAELREECGKVASDGQFRLWLTDGYAAAVCPLVAGDAPCGALAVLGPAHFFDDARIALVQDIAGRVAIAMENSRLHAAVQEADRCKSEFLAMLAHELRSPLAPISNAVRIMQDSEKGPLTIQWACDLIGRQVRHMARLIEDLLDMSRLEQGKVAVKREALKLAAIVEGAVESCAPEVHARKQTIAVQLPPAAIEIQGDRVRLVQALSNLIDNASKFSGESTTIRIAAAHDEGAVRICVEDEGTGIAAAFLPRVFDLFWQGEQSLDRPQGGLGIGLTLVKVVVELHGGRVAVHSGGPGKGTEVVVHLPA